MIEPTKIHDALLKTKIKLAAWLQSKLSELDPDYWHNLVLPKVSHNQKLNIDCKHCTKLSQLDLAMLLRIINKNWDDLSYKFSIEARVRNYLNEVQEIRNRYSHLSDYPSAADFHRDVDTLARFLSGIGIDEDFVLHVEAIGKENTLEEEVVIDSYREPKRDEEAEPIQHSIIDTDITRNNSGDEELPPMNDVHVIDRDPFAPRASLVRTKMCNNGVCGFATDEVDGEKAREMYLALRDGGSVPVLSDISHAIVAKRESADATPLNDAKLILDTVLYEDNVDGFYPCVALDSPDERLLWFFGKAANSEIPFIGDEVTPLPRERTFSAALPVWWSKMASEIWFANIPHLGLNEVQHTMDLSKDDLWRYMKTYAPRSWAEAFYLVKTIGREKIDQLFSSVDQRPLSIMDVGCGVGGALFGVLDALDSRGEFSGQIDVAAFDVNQNALEMLAEYIEKRSEHPDTCLKSTRIINLKTIARSFAKESEMPSSDTFDLIVASKSIGEAGGDSFKDFLCYARGHLNPNGVVLVIELLKHEQELKDSISSQGISMANVESLSVRIGRCGESCDDNEKVITATIYRNMFQ